VVRLLSVPSNWKIIATSVGIQVGVSIESIRSHVARTGRGNFAVTSGVVLLIRHAHTDAIGNWLAGRAAGVPLSMEGAVQAQRLADALSERYRIAAVYTSPLERAQATAAALAHRQQVGIDICEELSEIDFGAWTGRTFAALEADPAWLLFNRARSRALIPGGERVQDVQTRMVRAIADVSARDPGSTIAVVSHGDPLRFALLYYQDMSIDRYPELELEPASVSAVRLTSEGPRILYINDPTFAAA
jgi:broad specificity phosphatase PhoE